MEQAEKTRPRLEVATAIFEGPLELLLALVERHDLDILQVSLAALTDSYLAAVARMHEPDTSEMADFLWMAARLLVLKSLRLLPGEEPEGEAAELLGWEEEVRQRLNEYRVYKAMAQELMDRVSQDSFAFPAPPRAVEVEGQEEPLEMGFLLTAFEHVLQRLPPRPVVVRGRSWTPAEKIAVLRERTLVAPVELVELLLECEDRLEAVVTFVAVLELLRQGEVTVRQDGSFGPIWVERRR
jgi:segregation and condensation protein A